MLNGFLFLKAALPWVLTGLLIAFAAAGRSRK